MPSTSDLIKTVGDDVAERGRQSRRNFIDAMVTYYAREDLSLTEIRFEDWERLGGFNTASARSIMKKLCRALSEENAKGWPHRSEPRIRRIKVCLRAEAFIYLQEAAKQDAA